MPKDNSIKKVLVIGSGPIVIGQAAEFDYAGTQACRALMAEGVEVVLVNSNPATIMTDPDMATAVYIEPLTARTVERIIEKEQPDSLLAGLGGQTGLNLAMELYKSGFLQSHNVRLIGTNIDAILKSEDRQLFKDAMKSIDQPTIPSRTANSLAQAMNAARAVGYPVIIRPAFTLGGSGGGVAHSEKEMEIVAQRGLDASPIHQILVERYIFDWKEIEFEVMRDRAGTAITICSMENFDPVGVHTGDSIVVAPALTLADKEYQMLRSAALRIIGELGIEGGCNCQFALNPESFEYAVIEVNPRVSRSSALASKATGYPIAKVSAKIALGYTLDEIKNEVTGETYACFEPALDYVVCKLPRWPFDKFYGADNSLGPQMKATGEVMSIAPTFEAALMKAIRGAGIKEESLNRRVPAKKPLQVRLREIDDMRVFTLFEALKSGYGIDELHELTKVDEFFLTKLNNMVQLEAGLARGLTPENVKLAREYGYTESLIAKLSGQTPPAAPPLSYKMVDTCAAEFEAKTPYFYSVPGGQKCDAREKRGDKPTVVVLGSGPIRIGQGIEFDYSSVHCVSTLRAMGYDVVIINNNPETVSTDYDTASRLYFEPLCPEDVMGVIAVEQPVGVVVAFGGQTAISLAQYLVDRGVKILGTSAEGIDLAEDREKFDALLESLQIKRPRGAAVHSLDEAIATADDLGYPVLLRPSYVIGGQNMVIAHDEAEVRHYMDVIITAGNGANVLIDQYLPGTELECDVISDGERVLIPGIMEHIERAGIHSGDSIAVCPPYNLSEAMTKRVLECSRALALALGTEGLVNIQYLVFKDELYVIEVNPRASRTVPYLSKISALHMADVATRVMMGETLESMGYPDGLAKAPDYVGIKVPVFSFEKVPNANSILGPEMKSTGEVLGIGRTFEEALYKGLTAAGFKFVSANGEKRLGVLLSVENRQLGEIGELVRRLDADGRHIYATPDTAAAVKAMGHYAFDIGSVTAATDIGGLLERAGIGLVIYTGALHDDTMGDYTELHYQAVKRGIPTLTSIDTALAAVGLLDEGWTEDSTELVDVSAIGLN